MITSATSVHKNKLLHIVVFKAALSGSFINNNDRQGGMSRMTLSNIRAMVFRDNKRLFGTGLRNEINPFGRGRCLGIISRSKSSLLGHCEILA
jgi:hypothetical protein